jgi:MYXO-CTERM domain-containing protein
VAGRDPDAIAREIEQTRAELAQAVDAIADRVSPKNVATRGAEALKAQVTAAKDKPQVVAAAAVGVVIVAWLVRRRRRR